MGKIEIELTKNEYEMLTKIKSRTLEMLKGMTKEERLAWFSHYPHPVNFKQEINGTVYSVNAHFNNSAEETLVEQAENILLMK